MSIEATIYLHGLDAITVPAVIIGDLAVHRPTNDGKAFEVTSWHVTHIPTGMAVAKLVPPATRRTRPSTIAWAARCTVGCADHWAAIKALSTFGASEMPEDAKVHLRAIYDWAREDAKR